MQRVYYATHNVGAYLEGAVVLLDDELPEELGLAESGYFARIVTPEKVDGPAESPDRAG